MNPDDMGRLAYLGLLGAALLGWLIVENRHRMGAMLRLALSWGLIFVGMVAAYGLWTDIRTDIAPQQAVMIDGGRIELPRAPDGHYYLTLRIGETPVRFMVDTGATNVVLSDRDVDRLGIDRRGLAFLGQARTANGTIRTARVTLEDVWLGDFGEGRLIAWVGDGPLETSLLGMDYLNRFSRVEFSRDRLVLER